MATHRMTRRAFPRGAGVTLALPLLDRMAPRGSGAEAKGAPPLRLVCINTTLGLHAENLFPRETGRDYRLTPYLEVLQEFRDEFTIFSGLSHPEVDGSHASDASFLTAAPHPGASSHDTKNMPILLAGGGFRHGRHLAFDPLKHPPLCNLYVQMLQRLGVETDQFASSTGTAIPGFEMNR